jgi:hypothetical protein
MLTMKGSLLGILIFAILTFSYLVYVFFSLGHILPRTYEQGQVGIDVGSFLFAAMRNPMYWVTLIVICTFSSALLRRP